MVLEDQILSFSRPFQNFRAINSLLKKLRMCRICLFQKEKSIEKKTHCYMCIFSQIHSENRNPRFFSQHFSFVAELAEARVSNIPKWVYHLKTDPWLATTISLGLSWPLTKPPFGSGKRHLFSPQCNLNFSMNWYTWMSQEVRINGL